MDFEESKVRGSLTTLDTPSKDISIKYTSSNGQNGEFFNYGVLNRKVMKKHLREKLLRIFQMGILILQMTETLPL